MYSCFPIERGHAENIGHAAIRLGETSPGQGSMPHVATCTIGASSHAELNASANRLQEETVLPNGDNDVYDVLD